MQFRTFFTRYRINSIGYAMAIRMHFNYWMFANLGFRTTLIEFFLRKLVTQ